MSCGTGECGCGCGELHHIRVKLGVAPKVGAKEFEGEGPKAGGLERSRPAAGRGGEQSERPGDLLHSTFLSMAGRETILWATFRRVVEEKLVAIYRKGKSQNAKDCH